MTDLTTVVIFGASGDLTQRKLIPALFNLCRKKRLPEPLRIVGFARRSWSDGDFRSAMRMGVDRFAGFSFTDTEWDAFEQRLFYQPGQFRSEDIARLGRWLTKFEAGPANRLYYLATLPQYFGTIISDLGRANMTAQADGWRRIVVEKPFGRDLASAQALNQTVHEVLDESQIYRIDHYLGKETVQNVLIFRFANAIFEPIWNRNYIDNVQITVSEHVGVEHRGAFYETAGVLRDMFQNHLLQLLTLIALEPPASFNADAVRNERVKVLSAVRPLSPEDVAQHTVRGQYHGYRSEEAVAPDSQIPTFAATRLWVDNWRWQGVPFYLRSGKNLADKSTHIDIEFRCPPHLMFPNQADKDITPNVLTLCIQPDEGMHLRFQVKVPDTTADISSVEMNFHYREPFGSSAIPEAYERLIIDAINGDASLFTRGDQIELSWRIIDSIIGAWSTSGSPPLLMYEPGTEGPPEVNDMIARDGRHWHSGCLSHSGMPQASVKQT